MRSNEETKLYYNGIAKGYSNLYHDEQIKKINLIKEFIPKSGKILDIGAGDGVFNKFISKNILLYSFDISEELLKLNPNKTELKFIGDAEKLPFENNYFNCCVSFSVFQDIQNPKKAIREVYRVMKNNSIFIISFIKISSKKNLIINELFKYFNIIKKIEEEKDYIFVLNKIY